MNRVLMGMATMVAMVGGSAWGQDASFTTGSTLLTNRLRSDAAVLSPGEAARLSSQLNDASRLADKDEADRRVRDLQRQLSFAQTSLPGNYSTLTGPWPVTPFLTAPDVYAPAGTISTPNVIDPMAGLRGGWPVIDPPR